MRRLRVAVVCDFIEERWPSMDLVAEMLVDQITNNFSDSIEVARICPPMHRRFTRDERPGGKRFNADRFLNRFWDYPRFVRRLANDFDLFHLVDHSYSQLLHDLPAAKSIVTCHDLDTFKCLLDPESEPRSFLFRRMMSRTLSGFRQAARVTCDSVATRDEVLSRELLPIERTVVVPNGVHQAFTPKPNNEADINVEKLIGAPANGQIDLFHVGSVIPRKRIDVLLQVFAQVRKVFPRTRLLHAGGQFTPEQINLATKLNLRAAILVLPQVDRNVLAALYRRATLVLLPSEREGFGLPVVESMACGTPVIASDLSVLREVGGEAVQYCSVGDVGAWSHKVIEMLKLKCEDEHAWCKLRAAGVNQAEKFTWAEYANKMANLYFTLTNGDSH